MLLAEFFRFEWGEKELPRASSPPQSPSQSVKAASLTLCTTVAALSIPARKGWDSRFDDIEDAEADSQNENLGSIESAIHEQAKQQERVHGASENNKCPADRLRQDTDDPKLEEEAQGWAEAYQASADAEYRVAGKVPTLEASLGYFRQYPVKSFRHCPLDQTQASIRLVHLLPNLSPDGLIQCTMSHASLSRTYVCLSYVWEIPIQEAPERPKDPNTRFIYINGQPFRITQNLFEFLRMARHNAARTNWDLKQFNLSVPFWIDAICIDQQNNSEKNHQVKQMGKIYSRAQSVQVWLGVAPSFDSDDGMLQDLPGVGEYQSRLEKFVYHWTRAIPKRDGGPFLDSDWEYGVYLFRFIFQNPYWQRAWVVQEFFQASRLMIWIYTYPLDMMYLRRMRNCLYGLGFAWDSLHYQQYHSSKLKSPTALNLLEALCRFQDKLCRDPRDRVFSLLSLCPKEQSSIAVDYNVPLSHLAYTILSSKRSRVCICTAAVVADALSEKTLGGHLTPQRIPDDPWIEFNIKISSSEDYPLKSVDYISQSQCKSANLRLDISGWTPAEKRMYCMPRAGTRNAATVRVPLFRLPPIVSLNGSVCHPGPSSGLVRLSWGKSEEVSK
ncbi:heterokaryon incompatibility protein-domain-containing protein [Boeremia exigua]|uniref:heterokaryon incompatibility protein-domain-containing protein n=1 Tax=Boeremia exigua TaxID=749465 RepID=UPI001E8D19EC|nr:heterokaryon incompatibility protein-domain-containing protein [Boeremia exigua]KAH6633302.1 heterokaryon incompatibility protein-domain-containing protein [Boeremia exigua]